MDYSTLTKEQLLAEIEQRRKSGRVIDGNSATLKDDLIAGLQLDDQTQPAPAPAPSNIPTVAPKVPTIPEVATSEPALDKYSGLYTNSVDGEDYALAINEDAPDNKTHFLRNSVHFDNCTKEEFKQRYEKK